MWRIIYFGRRITRYFIRAICGPTTFVTASPSNFFSILNSVTWTPCKRLKLVPITKIRRAKTQNFHVKTMYWFHVVCQNIFLQWVWTIYSFNESGPRFTLSRQRVMSSVRAEVASVVQFNQQVNGQDQSTNSYMQKTVHERQELHVNFKMVTHRQIWTPIQATEPVDTHANDKVETSRWNYTANKYYSSHKCSHILNKI